MTTQENKISFNEYVKANTDQDQFKIIDDEKNTPSLNCLLYTSDAADE